MLLYKDCATTALIGLTFLGSCVLTRKPVVSTWPSATEPTAPTTGWQTWDTYRDFRAGMYVTSYLWAALSSLRPPELC